MAAAIIGARNMGKLEFLELAVYDYCFRFRQEPDVEDSRIILVTISEKDIQNAGAWPFTDTFLAGFLKTILEHSPVAVGLDLYRDLPVYPGKEELSSLFSDNVTIITIKKLGDVKSPGVPGPYMVEDTSLTGYNDIPVDPEGIVRRGSLFLEYNDENHYSFAMLLSMLYLNEQDITPEPDPVNSEFMRLGKTTFIPLEPDAGGYVGIDSRGYQFLLDFSGTRAEFQTISMSDVLSKKFSPGMFAGKIVIIGSVAESLKDFFFLPFDRPSGSRKIYGVELHATIVSQLLRSARQDGKTLDGIAEPYEKAWIILWSLVGCLSAVYLRSFVYFISTGIAALAILAGVTVISLDKGFWIPTVPPAIASSISATLVIAYRSYMEKTQRELLMRLFSSHVSQDVADAVWKERENFMESGRPLPQELTATVLFTDLKGFTTVSEKLGPAELMDWLNEFMGAMVDIVIDYDGIVNKFIGDAVMAVFGIPVARTNEAMITVDAVNAVKCAIAMGKKLESLNDSWQKQGRSTMSMRVGIYTGPLVVGSLGTRQRQEYTVIGDTVNIAARLESFDKTLDACNTCRILIGQATKDRIGDAFVTKKLTDVSLKGKVKKIDVYQVSFK